LVRSSGDQALDEEAVSLPRRASPLPKPPDGVGSGSISLSVPIHFGH
jgi:protein TonB